MKKLLLVLATSLLALSAKATEDIKMSYQCFFTEPFISLGIYSLGTSQVGNVGDPVFYSAPGERSIEGTVIARTESSGITSFTIDAGRLNKLVLEIDMFKKGNDGMSDVVYDFEGILKNIPGKAALYGGCNLKVQ